MKNQKTNEELLENLIHNSFDFLKKALDEINEYPKFSIINFHAGIELIFKAVLMNEHWTLILTNSESPNKNKFLNGDFHTISMNKAIDKIQNVTNHVFTDKQLKAFSKVTQHRNKSVHFFHEAHSSNANENYVQAIVKEQLIAWYFLQIFITDSWSHIFKKYTKEIEEINTKLKTLNKFLEISYEQIQTDIIKKTQEGEIFVNCSVCGYKSQHHSEEKNVPYEAQCLVCDFSEYCLRLDCIDCSHEILFQSEGFGQCLNCLKRYESDDLAEILLKDISSSYSYKELSSNNLLANCDECGDYHTIIPVDDNEYFCTNCFVSFDSLYLCEWCGENCSNSSEDTYAFGCNHCDGVIGWNKELNN